MRPPQARKAGPGFSLIEVVMAIGIFATGIVTLIGLFGPLATSARKLADAAAAAALGDLLRSELHARVQRDGTFAPVEALLDPGASDDSRTLYASRDGTRITSDDESVPARLRSERFFAITLQRPDGAIGSSGFLLTYVARVRWPASAPTHEQETLLLPGVVMR